MRNTWKTIKTVSVEDYKIFEVHRQKKVKSYDASEHIFTYIKSPQWVNIIPITPDGEIVFIKQFRHGIQDITLEIPGGLVEEGEDFRIAAERECAEETGFISPELSALIGSSEPNPAFMNNLCRHYVWRNCEKQFAQNLDMNEEIDVELIPFAKVEELIRVGVIKHSLVICAFHYYNLIENNINKEF